MKINLNLYLFEKIQDETIKSFKNYHLNKSLPDLRTQKVLDYTQLTKDKETSKQNHLNQFATQFNSHSNYQLSNQQAVNQMNCTPINQLKVNFKTIKTGWLMRKAHNSRHWFRHWFVLKDTLLTYYRDQSAELNSLLDGVFDLVLVKRVHLKNSFRVSQNSSLIYWPFYIKVGLLF